jgi:glutathione S-transferase
MTDQPLHVVGMPGSPYSRKLRAVLRYRRIPYAWVHLGSVEARGLPQPRVALLPELVLRGPDGSLEAAVDSTPLIHRLEGMYAARAVIPPDPVIAFVDAVLEDYADEWLTKAMFHYRWAFAPDVAHAAAILPRWPRTNRPESESVALGELFAKRQVDRLPVVGSNETTAAVIEDSYRRLLRLLDAQLTVSRFVMGDRPGASDFALFGQLTQLAAFDPTSAAIALEVAPRVVAWVDVVEDLSGLEPSETDWRSREHLPDTLRALLGEVGRVYAPFLISNAAALERGAARVECTIDGSKWVQRPFPYQGKCLRWLREGHAALSAEDRGAVDALLRGTGCERLFAAEGEGTRP